MNAIFEELQSTADFCHWEVFWCSNFLTVTMGKLTICKEGAAIPFDSYEPSLLPHPLPTLWCVLPCRWKRLQKCLQTTHTQLTGIWYQPDERAVIISTYADLKSVRLGIHKIRPKMILLHSSFCSPEALIICPINARCKVEDMHTAPWRSLQSILTLFAHHWELHICALHLLLLHDRSILLWLGDCCNLIFTNAGYMIFQTQIQIWH